MISVTAVQNDEDSPARQRHRRISSAAEVVSVQLTPRRIVTFFVLMRLLNTLTHSLTIGAAVTKSGRALPLRQLGFLVYLEPTQ